MFNHRIQVLKKGDIPEAGESAYLSTDDDLEISNNGMLLGAGILPFTITPNGELLFILGKEHKVPGWKGSETWSAFEGGTKGHDTTAMHTAAREYIEESLGVLHPEEECTKNLISSVYQSLIRKEYLFRVTLVLRHMEAPPKYHVTFVKYFEWDPLICETFDRHRRDLLTVTSILRQGNIKTYHELSSVLSFRGQDMCKSSMKIHNGKYTKYREDRQNSPMVGNTSGEHSPLGDTTSTNISMGNIYNNHAAFVTKRAGTDYFIDIANDFLEKSEVRYWSADELLTVVTAKDTPGFRPCFIRTMTVILDEFKRRICNGEEDVLPETTKTHEEEKWILVHSKK